MAMSPSTLQAWLDTGTRRGALVALAAAAAAWYWTAEWRMLWAIPTAGGPRWPLLSFIGTRRFIQDAAAMVQEGISQYKGRMFKIAALNRWIVVAHGKALMEELSRLPEEVMSSPAALSMMLEARYTMGYDVVENPFQVELLRSRLHKSLPGMVPGLCEEAAAALEYYIPERDDAWVPVPAMDLMRAVITRASHRVLVGPSKCREKDWISLNISYVDDVLRSSTKMSIVPALLKPLVGERLFPIKRDVQRGITHLAPLIEAIQTHKDTPKEDFVLRWLVDHQQDQGKPIAVEDMVRRIFCLSFGAVHTTTLTLTHAFYNLAAYPHYIQPLREEVEAVVREHGWTKASLSKLHKLDSFIKESMRFNTGGFTLLRVAQQPHTFGDGTKIPAGTLVIAPVAATQRSEEVYEHANEFLPFRYYEQRGGSTESARLQLSATSLDFIPFGHGRYACPGRFLAHYEMIAILAHIVLKYDVRTEVEGVRPSDFIAGPQSIPNIRAKVLFKKRRL